MKEHINIRTCIAAAGVAVLLLFLSYISTNCPVPITGEGTAISFIHALFPSLSKEVPQEVVCIDVSHDKQLTPISKNREHIGNTAITDRKTLCAFLSRLKNECDYKYILLDVAFLEGESTPYDSLLFNTITSMDRIVCARSSQYSSADTSLLTKSGYADYFTSLLNTDFNKYVLYARPNEPSMAAYAYEELTGRSVQKKCGLFWFEGKSFSRKVFAPYLCFHAESTSNLKKLDNKVGTISGRDLKSASVLCMGSQALRFFSPIYYKDKIVVIGSFSDEDSHTTYHGQLAGPLIHLNALYALFAKEHLFPLWYILLVYIFFFFLAFSFLLSKRSEKNTLVWIWAKKSIVLFTFVCLSYILFHRTIDVFITATILSAVEYCLSFLKK